MPAGLLTFCPELSRASVYDIFPEAQAHAHVQGGAHITQPGSIIKMRSMEPYTACVDLKWMSEALGSIANRLQGLMGRPAASGKSANTALSHEFQQKRTSFVALARQAISSTQSVVDGHIRVGGSIEGLDMRRCWKLEKWRNLLWSLVVLRDTLDNLTHLIQDVRAVQIKTWECKKLPPQVGQVELSNDWEWLSPTIGYRNES